MSEELKEAALAAGEEFIFFDNESDKEKTSIQNRYCFWYHRRGGRRTQNMTNYEETIKKLASFQTGMFM